jgi:hypothetical protein
LAHVRGLKGGEGSRWEEEGEAWRRGGVVRTTHTLSTCFPRVDDKDEKEMVEGLSSQKTGWVARVGKEEKEGAGLRKEKVGHREKRKKARKEKEPRLWLGFVSKIYLLYFENCFEFETKLGFEIKTFEK